MKHMMKFLVLIALLSVGVFAQEFPGPFVVNGVPVSNLVIVVADTAPASDVIAAIKIIKAFYPDISQTEPAPQPERLTRLTSEIDDISNYNSIVIGSDCYNPITAQLLNNPIQCGQSFGLKLIKHPNGNIVLLIMGTTEAEVKMNVENWVSGSAAQPKADCTDSDGGLNIFTAGQTNTASGGTVDNCDFLTNVNGIMNEAMCDANGNPAHKATKCPESAPYCRDAVCTTDSSPACKDTDGANAFTRGTIYERRYADGPKHTDYCQNMQTLQPNDPCEGPSCGVREFTCQEPYVTTTYKDVQCANGCNNGACLTETLPQPVVDTVPSDYRTCMDELIHYKKQLLESYPEGEIPEEKMQNYQEMHSRCQRLAPPVEAERFKLPPGETICPPGSEQVVPGVCAGQEPPVKVIEAKEPCTGCARNSHCLAYGIRLLEDDKPMYCDIDSLLKPQKALSEACQNNYECLSNSCSQKCISVEERIEAVERELREQRSLIEKILDFFRNIFGG